MNFIKKNIKLIIGIIIGAILISGISVYATSTIMANQVTYKNGKTVEQALNELYGRKVKILKIGDYDSSQDREIDIAAILPDDYSKLTKNNFVITNAKMNWTTSNMPDEKHDIIQSYDAETGKLYLSKCWIRENYRFWVEYTLGCIIGEVEVVESL